MVLNPFAEFKLCIFMGVGALLAALFIVCTSHAWCTDCGSIASADQPSLKSL